MIKNKNGKCRRKELELIGNGEKWKRMREREKKRKELPDFSSLYPNNRSKGILISLKKKEKKKSSGSTAAAAATVVVVVWW